MKVAIQGERGSFSEEAAEKLLGPKVQFESCATFEEVFEAVAGRRARYCLVPIENSLAGSIHKTYDLLLEHHLHIVREVTLRIRHHLIAPVGLAMKRVEKVLSHPVALAQCEKFFLRNPRLKAESAYDTAGSIKKILEEGIPNAAAIAGRRAAAFYGARILRSNIEDNPQNFTRFFLLSRRPEVSRQADKTSIVFSGANRPGMLFHCLAVFALRQIDLSKIESRPLHGRPWEYRFYIDFIGNARSERCRNALRHLEEVTDFVKILGCYPQASD